MWKFPFRLRGDESTSSSCTLEEIEDELSPVPMVKKKQGKSAGVVSDK